jgi:anaerobic selenocysteine-containing dehydrogenase
VHVERGHRLHDLLRHRRAHGLLRRYRSRRCLRHLGQQHGGDASGAFLAHARQPQAPHRGRIIDFATRRTRTSQAADKSILFRPQTDLAVANAICHEIIANNWVNTAFVDDHVSFHKGKTNIGYGTEDISPLPTRTQPISFADYKLFLADYTPEKVEKISGVPAKDIKYLAALYGDPR